jgi:hypothetical protein
VAWSASVLDGQDAGTAFNATAGPSVPSPLSYVSSTLTSDQVKLYDYVKAHQNGAKYVLATNKWQAAAPYILAIGDTFLPMGGFSGSVPQPSLSGFQNLVQKGELRYILITGSGGTKGGGSGSMPEINTWVAKNCTKVPSTAYGVAQTSTSAQSPSAVSGSGGTLYNCTPSS